MKRIRPSRLSEQLLQARPSRQIPLHVRCQAFSSTTPAANEASEPTETPKSTATRTSLPSPHPSRAASSAKLAALHARIGLSSKVPLETLARTLVCPSADENVNFNNGNLSFLGSTLINFHVTEHLLCKWPRLPVDILWEVIRAYAGVDCLRSIARRWGVEAAAAPGEEVDPGLLQWDANGNHWYNGRWGYLRSEGEQMGKYRIGMSSRIVMDDDMGDQIGQTLPGQDNIAFAYNRSYATFTQAVIGSVYVHSGAQAAKDFIAQHILSRTVDPESMFEFGLPTRDLSLLCRREGFEPPIARLLSETGRHSRTPVFNVGIYSGPTLLAQAASHSLDTARRKASMNALKAWYLYSPGNNVRVPSDMDKEGAEPWTAPYIDIGHIV